MSIYLLTYQLNPALIRPQVYRDIEQAITSIPGIGWWHYFDNTWVVETTVPIGELSDRIHNALHPRDYLLVVPLTGDVHGWMSDEMWDGLEQMLRRRDSPTR